MKKDKSNKKKAKRQKSQSVLIQGLILLPFVSLFFCSLISSFLMVTGCSKPIVKMPKPLPPIVKQYKHITVSSTHPAMRNTRIYMNQGDLYSILATGSIKIWPKGVLKYRLDVTPEGGRILMARIGKKNDFFYAVCYGHSASTIQAYNSGYLYLGIRDGGVNVYGEPRNPRVYDDNIGSFSVDVIVWEREDYVQIADFFEKMKGKDPNNKAIIDAHNEVITESNK